MRIHRQSRWAQARLLPSCWSCVRSLTNMQKSPKVNRMLRFDLLRVADPKPNTICDPSARFTNFY